MMFSTKDICFYLHCIGLIVFLLFIHLRLIGLYISSIFEIILPLLPESVINHVLRLKLKQEEKQKKKKHDKKD